jgi:HEAT repeat protein
MPDVPARKKGRGDAEALSKDERHPAGPAAEAPVFSPICGRFIHKLAATPDKKRRLGILKACAKVRASWVEELFWEALGDPCEGVRGFVFLELARKRTLDLGLALSRLGRPPWYARSAVLKLLGIHRAQAAIPEIIKALEGTANADIRRSAAEALGEIGGEEALGLLVGLKKDRNPYVRQAAEEAIRKASEVRFI